MTLLNLITKEDLEQFKTELFAELKDMPSSNLDGHLKQPWLKSMDVRKILNISPGTLQNLRVNGIIPFSKVGSILYYKREERL